MADFLQLVQLSSVAAIASVLVAGGSADLYSKEPWLSPINGLPDTEPGNRRPVFVLKYRGRFSTIARWTAVSLAGFQAATYPVVLSMVAYGCWNEMTGWVIELGRYLVLMASLSIGAACALAAITTVIRWNHVRS